MSPFADRLPDRFPVGTRYVIEGRGREGSPGQGNLTRAGRIRHVCPQARALVSAGGPRPPARGSAKDWMGRLTKEFG